MSGGKTSDFGEVINRSKNDKNYVDREFISTFKNEEDYEKYVSGLTTAFEKIMERQNQNREIIQNNDPNTEAILKENIVSNKLETESNKYLRDINDNLNILNGKPPSVSEPSFNSKTENFNNTKNNNQSYNTVSENNNQNYNNVISENNEDNRNYDQSSENNQVISENKQYRNVNVGKQEKQIGGTSSNELIPGRANQQYTEIAEGVPKINLKGRYVPYQEPIQNKFDINDPVAKKAMGLRTGEAVKVHTNRYGVALEMSSTLPVANKKNVRESIDKEYGKKYLSTRIFDKPTHITSLMGARSDASAKDRRVSAMHYGIDWHAPIGTPVKPLDGGKVIFAGIKGGYGKTVAIEQPDGKVFQLGHLSQILVKKGDIVSPNQHVGLTGNTGKGGKPTYDAHLDTVLYEDATMKKAVDLIGCDIKKNIKQQRNIQKTINEQSPKEESNFISETKIVEQNKIVPDIKSNVVPEAKIIEQTKVIPEQQKSEIKETIVNNKIPDYLRNPVVNTEKSTVEKTIDTTNNSNINNNQTTDIRNAVYNQDKINSPLTNLNKNNIVVSNDNKSNIVSNDVTNKTENLDNNVSNSVKNENINNNKNLNNNLVTTNNDNKNINNTKKENISNVVNDDNTSTNIKNDTNNINNAKNAFNNIVTNNETKNSNTVDNTYKNNIAPSTRSESKIYDTKNINNSNVNNTDIDDSSVINDNYNSNDLIQGRHTENYTTIDDITHIINDGKVTETMARVPKLTPTEEAQIDTSRNIKAVADKIISNKNTTTNQSPSPVTNQNIPAIPDSVVDPSLLIPLLIQYMFGIKIDGANSNQVLPGMI